MPEVKLSDVIGDGYSDFWYSQHRYRALIGGRASKKSTTTALWYIYNMMKYEGANLLCIRKVFKDHRDSTYTQLKWAIKQLGVEELWSAKINPFEITYLPTGQKILFRGLDDPMSITSITVDNGFLCWCWFEEAFQVSNESDFNMVDGSIRGLLPDHLFKQITLSMNPWNEKHWIKKRFFDVKDENVFTLQTNYICNEFLDDADRNFFETMKKNNPRRYWVEGLGNWGIAEGLIYNNWVEEDFDYQEIMRERRGNIIPCFGLDFGYTADPTGFIASLIDKEKKEIYIFDEIYEKGLLNNQIASEIREKGFSKEKIVADSAEPKSIAELKQYGLSRIRPARKGKDSIVNGIQFLLQFKIIVHPMCVSTQLELNNYAWVSKNGKLFNEPIGEYNHLLDALRYSMEEYSRPSGIRFFGSKKHRH